MLDLIWAKAHLPLDYQIHGLKPMAIQIRIIEINLLLSLKTAQQFVST